MADTPTPILPTSDRTPATLEAELKRKSPFASWQMVEVVFPTTPGQDVEIPHTLVCPDPDQVGWMVVRSSGAGVVSRGMMTLWGNGFIKLRSTLSGQRVTLLVFVPMTAFSSSSHDGSGTYGVLPSAGWFDVRAYGAVGDGSTDDTAALQAACDAAVATHGTVFVPSGVNLRLTSMVTTGAVRIVGASRDTSRIFVDYDGIGLYANGDSVSTFELRKVTVSGLAAFDWVFPTRTSQVGLKISTTHNCVVNGCTFTNLYHGVELEGIGYYNIVEGNLFFVCVKGVRTMALSGDGPSEANILYNQFNLWPTAGAQKDSTTAIAFDTGGAYKVIGNGIELCGTGIALGEAEGTLMLGNRFEKNTAHFTQNAGIDSNMIIGGYDDTGLGFPTFVGTVVTTYGTRFVGRSATLNTTTAENGTGGGNREFGTSFTGASATGFTGTDNTDQGYGYFPVTITAGKTYVVVATMTPTNGALLRIITSTGKDFSTGLVDEITASPVTSQPVRFTASANAAYVGIAAYRTSGTMQLVVADFNIREVNEAFAIDGLGVAVGNGATGGPFTTITSLTVKDGIVTAIAGS